MAQSPESNEAFFREVDEELRREQLAGFGKRYGLWIGVAILVVLIAVAGGLYWYHAKQSKAADQGVEYNAAMEKLGNGDLDAAGKRIAPLTRSKIDGYRAMARFMEADVALKNDDLKSAAAKFAEVANDDDLPKPYRDLATIRQTIAQYDMLKPADVIQRLRPLAVKGSPWFGTAGEMIAIAYLREGRRDLASSMFNDLASAQDIPDSIRQRAVQLASGLDMSGGKAASDDGASTDEKTKEKKAG